MKHEPTGCWKKLRWPGGILLLGIGWVGLQLATGTGEDSSFAVNTPVLADEEPFQDGLEAGDAEEESEYTVRLNFFNSTWPSVLRKLAEDTNSELVMKRAPAGRLTRADRNKYSRTDAVRLLNREIEPKGFRLLEQGNFLVVLHLDSLRTRYQRPTIPVSQPDETRQPKTAEHVATTANKPFPNNARDDSFRKPLVRTGSRSDSPPKPRLLQPAEFSREPVGRSKVNSPKSPTAKASPLLSPVTVPTRRRGAKAVAQVIYSALKDRAELIHDGPGHLPAFQVFHKQHAGRTRRASNSASIQFAVGIDTDREELVVAGTRDQQQDIVQMIRTIDAVESGPGRAIRLVASDKDMTKVTQNLRPALKMMLAQNTNNRAQGFGPQPNDTQPNANTAPNLADNQPQTQPGANVPAGNDPLLSVQGLRGPVTIQEVPGVGRIIIGDPRDVDAVMELMRKLEQLAVGVVPKIEFLKLQHVNSEALAELLSTVYEQLTDVRGTTQQSQSAIIPIVRPNAILIIAAQTVLSEIAELAISLDEPVDPLTEFQVFALKHAIAAQVVETLNTLYPEEQQQQQQQQAGGLRPHVRAVADVRTNSVIVQASPRDLKEVAALIRKVDRDAAAAVSRMKVFPLKNAVADELAEVITESIQSVLSPAQTTGGQRGGQGGGGQSTQQLSDAKSVVIEFLTNDGDARRVIRSGILADIRVTADPRVNSLIVAAPEQSMPLMAELIKQLDLPTSNVAEIKVFPLTNSDATGMAELLETLFTADDAQNQLGVQVAGAEDASSGLIPLRFSVDVRTNTIIAIGGAEALRVVEAILLRLDESDVRKRKTTVIKLKNSPADAVADAINRFLEAQGELADIDPELVSNVELLQREIIVEPELISNSLLISATPQYYEEILEMINRLDEAPQQVMIQVLIIEVLLDNTDEFGVELGFQDSLLFNRGLLNLDNFQTITSSLSDPGSGVVTTTETIVNSEGLPGFLFNNAQLGNNTAISPASVGQQALSNFGVGQVSGDLGFGGLVLSASSESVSVLVRALAAQRNVQILSRPIIRTVDNQLASIQVGQEVPIVTSATTTALGSVNPILGELKPIGIILQVTPRITPDGIIVMETIATKSAIAGQGVPLATDAATGTVVESPIFDITQAVATIAVPDGQTAVLGGMITQSDDTIERKVPWLGDIPLLGTAFRYDATTSRRTELIIFMTPRIIRNAADSELIKQVEAERLHYDENLADEIHGPIMAVPADTPFNAYPNSLTIPPGDFPADEEDVPTTIMPGSIPPLPGPTSSFNQIPVGMPIDENAAGRQSVQSMNQQTVRGSVPKRKKWFRRLPFLQKSK